MTTRVAALLLAGPLLVLCCRREGGERPAGSAVSPTGEAPKAPARVRAVDAIPDGRPLDLFAGDSVAFPALQYRAVTAYQELPGGGTSFRLRLAGQDRSDPLASTDASLSSGRHYTVVVLPSREARPAGLEVLDDALERAAAGRARVRLVNASPDAGEATVFVGGRTEALVPAVGAAEAGSFRDVAPVAGTLELRRDKDGPLLARLPDTRLEEGRLYTVFLLGRTTGGLEAMLVEDQPSAAP